MHPLEHFLDNVRCDVELTLDDLIPAATDEPSRLHEALRWSIFAGGKRIRPAIVIAAGEACGAARHQLLRTAAAVEMVHTYSLIHDDLPSMDDDNLRRGRATCHVRFGEATAILAGDVLQPLAYRAIAEDLSIDADTRVRLVSLFANASGTPRGMASGQQLDLEAEGKKLTIDEIRNIHEQKTGALIVASAKAGAIIAGADAAHLAPISEFAEKLGLLFQITDDLLDVTQATESLGKTAGKDLTAEKATYPAYFGVERTRELAAEVCAEAHRAIAPFGPRAETVSGLADYILSRTS